MCAMCHSPARSTNSQTRKQDTECHACIPPEASTTIFLSLFLTPPSCSRHIASRSNSLPTRSSDAIHQPSMSTELSVTSTHIPFRQLGTRSHLHCPSSSRGPSSNCFAHFNDPIASRCVLARRAKQPLLTPGQKCHHPSAKVPWTKDLSPALATHSSMLAGL